MFKLGRVPLDATKMALGVAAQRQGLVTSEPMVEAVAGGDDQGGADKLQPIGAGVHEHPGPAWIEQKQPPEPVGLGESEPKRVGRMQASIRPSVAESLSARKRFVRCYGGCPTRPFHLRVGAGRACIDCPSACAYGRRNLTD